MNVRILQQSDARAYQDLRLRGLATDPDAFGSTYERESRFTLEMVKERIQPNESKFVLGAYDDDNKLVGIVTFVRESGGKTLHKGNVFGMYVAGEKRNHGVGKRLMHALIEEAKRLNGLEQLQLAVVTDNESAKKLYRSVGFQSYGLEHRALKVGNRYFDEELMVLLFSGSLSHHADRQGHI